MAEDRGNHPLAPAGGGGPGVFSGAGPLGMNHDMDKWQAPGPLGVREKRTPIEEMVSSSAQQALCLEIEEALKNINLKKFLHAVRQAEFNKDSVVDKPDSEFYSLGFGFKEIDSFKDYPAVLVNSSHQMFSGAYQIGKKTWLAARNALGLTDFGPHSQDLAAAWLIKRRGQLNVILSGAWEKALPVLSCEWASLPQGKELGSHYQQPYMKFDVLKQHYDHYK